MDKAEEQACRTPMHVGSMQGGECMSFATTECNNFSFLSSALARLNEIFDASQSNELI